MLSPFFKLTLSLGGTFKFLQNCHRHNENVIKTFNENIGQFNSDLQSEYAGAAFMQDIWPHYLGCISNDFSIQLGMFSGKGQVQYAETDVLQYMRQYK